MENKKLLKFLFKDIDEIEELFEEKGKEGFDAKEMEFLRSRFAGTRKIIQIMSEQENDLPDSSLKSTPELEEKTEPGNDSLDEAPATEAEISMPEQLQSEDLSAETPKEEASSEQYEKREVVVESKVEIESVEVEKEIRVEMVDEEREVDAEELRHEAAKTLGDSLHKEKSLNELLTNGASNLEFKISNSPVSSIQTSIGINDRYQYIRELFEGSSDKFAQAVTELDAMSTINEAVAYLQKNYKWKKTETSLKFVSLVKRRFPNG